MEGLGVEFAREGDDLIGRHHDGAGHVRRAGLEVFEMVAGHGARGFEGKRPIMRSRRKANRARQHCTVAPISSAAARSHVAVIEVVPMDVIRIAAPQQEREQEKRDEKSKKQFGFAEA
ncbi:MAG TPA: hypothetical protein VKA80_15045 [Beijerinckiaceae bacterium]|nr:hypothetical protein [Beijerinckiaceae bacterium]